MSEIVIDTMNILKDRINDAISKAMSENLLPSGEVINFVVEVPADKSHGNFSTNVAMVCAKNFRMAPIKIAHIIAKHIDLTDTLVAKAEVAAPGFINFFLSEKFFAEVVKDVLEKGTNYGKSNYGNGKKVMVEFVSANPTGPMHMGNARGGALGDCLASVLETAGFNVYREFYINDAGNQIDKFAMSLDIRYQQIFMGEDYISLPEDSYHGEDILDLAKEFAEKCGDKYISCDEKTRRKALVDFALPRNIEKMQNDLKKYRINYDNWFHESDLHKNGEIKNVINLLAEKGLTYESDGALWYKATSVGLEKDEVLIRKNGTPTYFISDIAYHYNKFVKRNFDICIDLWGADHHGHVARVKKTMAVLGIDEKRLDVLLFQLVRLVKDGNVVRMSKRTGKAIQLADLLDEVPIDSARLLFNMREANSQMDFDLDLAKKQDSQNPVYYVQYAHARICSILKSLEKENIKIRNCSPEELLLLSSDEEKELINHLSKYTSEIIDAAKYYDPAKITRYVIELATLFHKFYNSHRVKNENENLMQARISLCIAVKTVIKNILTMFKINTPESM